MGKVIDIEQRRRAVMARSTSPGAVTAELGAVPFAFAQSVMLPSVALWRFWVATWSSLWLAPVGLEMRPVDPGGRPAVSTQVNRNR